MMIQERQTERSTSASVEGHMIPAPNRPLESGSIEESNEGLLLNSGQTGSNGAVNKASLSGLRPLIAVVDQHSFTRSCITKWLKDYATDIEIISFAMAEDFLRSSSAPDLILYHAHETAHNMKDTRPAPVKKLIEICSTIILSAADNPELLIGAFESGVRGYIPTGSTPVELLVKIIRLVRAGGVFVPPSSLDLHRTRRKDLTPGSTSRTPANQQFTPRQIAVLNQLTQGKANKIIAYELA